MPKKKNAFAFFLDHYIDEQRRKGRCISKRIGTEECGPLWEAMSEDGKQIYIDLAKAMKCEQGTAKKTSDQWNDPFCKPDNVGCKSMFGNEIVYIASEIRHEQALRIYNFYLIHCNYYCRTEEGVYLPAEIALVEFNLQEGIKQTFHKIINPGKVPLGYAYEVRRIAEEVHGLPFPPHDEGENNLNLIFNQVLNFLKLSSEKEDGFPPLFTIEENVRATTEILKQISKSEDDFQLNIFPVHRIFFWLKNKCTEYCGNEPGFPVLANAISEIEKDVFRYCTGISCKYHSELHDKFQNCSLAVVQRLVYIVCDHCCRHLKIKLIRGKHIPQNFIKRDSSSTVQSVANDLFDVPCYPPEESDYCGASTYASSIVDDIRSSRRDSVIDVEEEEDFLSATDCLNQGFRPDHDVKSRGRGRGIGDV